MQTARDESACSRIDLAVGDIWMLSPHRRLMPQLLTEQDVCCVFPGARVQVVDCRFERNRCVIEFHATTGYRCIYAGRIRRPIRAR